MTGGLIAGNDAADRRRYDEIDGAEPGLLDLGGERPAEPLRAVGIHEDPRLLDEDRAAQTGRQDEMAFEDGPGALKMSMTSASVMALMRSAG